MINNTLFLYFRLKTDTISSFLLIFEWVYLKVVESCEWPINFETSDIDNLSLSFTCKLQ